VLEHLLARLGQSAQSTVAAEGRWHGHRTFFVDGSGGSMPDTPVWQAEFGQPAEQRPGCGFPVARLLALFHAGPGLFTQLISAPLLTHDLAQVQNVHPALAPGDVLVADRGLCSYAHIAMLVQYGMHAVFRIGSRQIVDFTPHRPFVMPAIRRSAAIKANMATTFFTLVGNSADSPAPLLRPSPATSHDAEMGEVEGLDLGYDADTCPQTQACGAAQIERSYDG
jgi:hypothetical protein